MSIDTNERAVSSEHKNRVRNARRSLDFTIDQDWISYSLAEHDRWDRLFKRSRETLRDRACDEFIAMMNTLKLSDSGIPNMEKLSERLEKITGWRVVPVAGLVPDDIFFNHLANKRFPAGAFIRSEQQMDYLEEPDIFHDIFGFHAGLRQGWTTIETAWPVTASGAALLVHGRIRVDPNNGWIAHFRRRDCVIHRRKCLCARKRLAQSN